MKTNIAASVVKVDARVIANTPVIAQHNVLVCHAPEIAQVARPGHFVNALTHGAGTQRKPFSVFQADPDSGRIALLYQVRGETTQGMAAKRPGDVLDLIGPLGGRVFGADPEAAVVHVLVGGGYGVPPLVFLAQRLRSARPGCDLRFVLGARSKELLLCETDIAGLNIALDIRTEDGTHGAPGRVTDALQEILTLHGPKTDLPARVYTCGPTSMMRAVAESCVEAGVPCQVSVAVPMPCGVGDCLECVIDTTDARRVRACLEGPVFDSRSITWK
ncbi:MAG: dihydroorotate dehydrogenase electron transfer subunit [Janthinobacterium lividum]